ncbi:MAG: restriction endonuclease subunit S [Methanosarcinaceae archaeon]|nr:restriction endonuclease subunit S [Methanosarcinaceae archaeon]
MKLIYISEVQTGLVLVRKRAYAKDKDAHKYTMLTLKSFDPKGWLNESELDVFFSKEKLENKYLTNKGDIIIRLTNPYTAICINDKQEGLVIPSNFAIIRLKGQKFIPEFVALFLNSEIIEKKFFKSSISTTIPLIKTKHLRDIDISEKPLALQKKIVELNQLQVKEKMLLSRLMKEKEKLAKASINKIIIEG